MLCAEGEVFPAVATLPLCGEGRLRLRRGLVEPRVQAARAGQQRDRHAAPDRRHKEGRRGPVRVAGWPAHKTNRSLRESHYQSSHNIDQTELQLAVMSLTCLANRAIAMDCRYGIKVVAYRL